MKKLLVILLALLMVFALPALAFAESGTVSVAVPAPLTWADILTKIVVWLIGGIASIASVLVWKWLYPLIKNSIVPWLEDKNMLMLADAAVKYAEASLGRYNGDKKWDLALDWLQDKGWNVDSETVIAALKAAWYSLNLDQLKAGIKDPEKPPERIEPPTE